MNKTLILKIGGEGGSISLNQKGNDFYYKSNESASLGMLDEEDYKDIKEILDKRKTEVFNTFELAMKSMLDRYPVFRLHPLEIKDQFKDPINNYYQEYLKANKNKDYCRNEKWEQILKN